MTTTPRYTIGVDVGGTFTDIFVLDEASGTIATAKVPSTRGDQSKGFVDGIAQAVGDFADVRCGSAWLTPGPAAPPAGRAPAHPPSNSVAASRKSLVTAPSSHRR